jgi:isoamylase
LASRLAGSGDLFNKRGRKPWASVNFITAHDGFTLNDLVSYNDKHNETNGENNQDGTSNNLSWNCGAEGPTDDPEINNLRERQKRNNNAYCQDNEINWVDWDGMTEAGRSLVAFTRKLIRLRQSLPILRRGRFLVAEYNPELEVKDVTWINAAGTEMQQSDWANGLMRCFGMLVDGRAQTSGIKRRASDVTLLIVVNAYHDVVKFSLPEFVGGDQWLTLVDTNDPERSETSTLKAADEYGVTGRSLLLFAALTSGEPVRIVRRIAFELLRDLNRRDG